MSREIRTDDDIAQLFADANPVPSTGMQVNGRPVRHVSNGDVDPVVVPLRHSDRPSQRKPSRLEWFLSGAVAAVVILAVVVAGLVAERGELTIGVADEADDADPVEDRNLATLMSFFAALNAGDAALAESLLGPGAAVAVAPVSPGEAIGRGVTLGDQVAWLVAWGTRFEDIQCAVTPERSPAVSAQLGLDLDVGDGRPGDPYPIDHSIEYDADAVCTYLQRSRLGDLDDATSANTKQFKMLDGRITYTTNLIGRHDWPPSFWPFVEWAESEHPELWRSAWDLDGPLLNPASIAIEDQLLTEYIELRTTAEDGGRP